MKMESGDHQGPDSHSLLHGIQKKVCSRIYTIPDFESGFEVQTLKTVVMSEISSSNSKSSHSVSHYFLQHCQFLRRKTFETLRGSNLLFKKSRSPPLSLDF